MNKFPKVTSASNTQTLVQLSTSQKEQMSDWFSAVYTARMVAVLPFRLQHDAKAMT
jgi:hypothetical protein